jgi:hypothetical protein
MMSEHDCSDNVSLLWFCSPFPDAQCLDAIRAILFRLDILHFAVQN